MSTTVADETPTKTAAAQPAVPGASPTIPEDTLDRSASDVSPPLPQAAAAPEPSPAPAQETAKPEPIATSEEEPQNPLTKKFTEAEWKALKEFRTQLPKIFSDAFPDDPDAGNKPYTMWGVTIDPQNPQNAKVSVVLMKFLRARNLSPSEAAEMLQSTLRWRQSFNVEAAMKEEYPSGVFDRLGANFGRDKEGRPVSYNLYGNAGAAFDDVQRFLRWRVAFMERDIQFLDFETVDQILQVHDYEGVSMSSRTTNSKNAASEATSIFQGHYPELLYRKFFVNVPTFLTWIFWIFKPLLSAATLAKMSVVGSGPRAIGPVLLPLIDASELPTRYGGNAHLQIGEEKAKH
ncbi:CRAL TRIO domain-containing protein [Coniophora puteana RWD-64-598 SS2]|uniref:Phosphatidylinositol transfer protein SFH5 n=1 Tax=Coniophora puteana (strain RWD-64-598) TaxID=741705 RepID=A0A5M3MKQ6_CONPW|nr:CRAL TRIO domain-containing protein [Coniophora puteana RWD-64-598 SS2]EIW79141.1 CRAL TRIO domain-containing protein [Coniophora puteana RWD-64-598 SS2]